MMLPSPRDRPIRYITVTDVDHYKVDCTAFWLQPVCFDNQHVTHIFLCGKPLDPFCGSEVTIDVFSVDDSSCAITALCSYMGKLLASDLYVDD